MDRPIYPIEVVTEFRAAAPTALKQPYYDEFFAPYRVGEFVYVRNYGTLRVGLITEIGHAHVGNANMVKYRIRLIQNDGAFAKRNWWYQFSSIANAYLKTYSDQEKTSKRTFPPFILESFLKDIRKW